LNSTSAKGEDGPTSTASASASASTLVTTKEDYHTNQKTASATLVSTAAQATKTKSMVPMSREEYEKQQATIREVFDPESGRYRLIRGSGEIIERIVSRSNHERINQIATRSDGMSFARQIHKGNAGE